MKIEELTLKPFDIFANQWALVTAGNMEEFNSCTVSWGSLGTIWTRPRTTGATATVYIYPSRHTKKLMMKNDSFTVSFFPMEQRKALAYIGSHSGRNENKAANAGLTPIAVGDSVTYKEASMTFVCKKLYQHQFSKGDLAPEIAAYYQANPKVYPTDENGDWQTHYVFIGEIMELINNET